MDSWNAFVKHWSTTVKYTAWFVLVAAIQNMYLLFPEDAGRGSMMVCGFLLSGLVGVWVSVRLYQAILALEDGQSVSAKTTATAIALVIPLAVLGIVQMFAVLGGLVLLILPGIYVGVRLAFSQLFLIEGGVKFQGSFSENVLATFRAVGAAISQSWEKTKGIFWPVFGRQLAGAILFLILTLIASAVVVSVVTLLVGGTENLNRLDETAMGAFLLGLANALVQVAFVAVMAVFQVKLYRAVKKA